MEERLFPLLDFKKYGRYYFECDFAEFPKSKGAACFPKEGGMAKRKKKSFEQITCSPTFDPFLMDRGVLRMFSNLYPE